jgi:hypothetical protein
MKETFYVVYKITNTINNMIYIGSHKTTKLNDKYYGSGKKIKEAIKQFGIENFKKEIISYHNSNEDMLLEEKKLVNRDFIERIDTYNLIIGGGSNSSNTILVKNKIGKCFRVDKNDERYLSGELETPNKGKFMATDNNGNFYRINKNDERYLSGELVSILKNKTLVKNENGDNIWVTINDDKFINGIYSHITKGRIASEECKSKLRKISHKNEKNPMFGKCYVTNKKTNKTIAILKEKIEEYINNGWYKGRPKEKTNNQLGTKWVKNEKLKKSKQVLLKDVDDYINKGWQIGRKNFK